MIIAASQRPQLAATGVTNGDKIVHFAVYGLLATLVARLGPFDKLRAGPGWRGAAWGLFAASLFGATDEWHQSFVPPRSCDVMDWLADTAGAALAVALYAGWARYRGWLERDLWQRRIENPAPPPTLADR